MQEDATALVEREPRHQQARYLRAELNERLGERAACRADYHYILKHIDSRAQRAISKLAALPALPRRQEIKGLKEVKEVREAEEAKEIEEVKGVVA